MMAKPTKASGPPIPPRRKSLSWDGSSQTSLTFPRSHHLIVTTAKGIFAWSSHGIKEIFRSGSEGIVAAKKASNGSGLIAVADSQVVVLHDVNKGMQRSYRLKGSDGQVRLLRYAEDSKSLFFTTTLQNAVQSYSLNQSRILDPSQAHPSPPTVFSLSPTSHLLLSASDYPPLIYLTNLTLGTRPISIRPQCSSSAVVAANFHPERPNIFILAFADGSAAVYDAVQLFHDNGVGKHRSGPARTGLGGEIASIKQLHVVGTWVSENEHSNEDAAGTIGVGSRGIGITAAAFVPGFNATTITVGADGKCCVVDFAKRGARVLNTWHLRAPATSLAILPSTDRSQNEIPRLDGATRFRSQSANNEGLHVAIGRQDGKVLLFDLAGNLLGEQPIDPSGTCIIDIEWMIGDGATEHESNRSKRRESGQSGSLAPIPRSKRKSLGSLLASGRPVAEEVLTIHNETEPPLNLNLNASVAQEPSPIRDRVVLPTSSALNHLDLFSPVKPALGTEVISRGSSIKGTKKTRGAAERVRRSGNGKNFENFPDDIQIRRPPKPSSRSSSVKVRPFPAIPPRPTPRKGGQLAAKHAEAVRITAVDKANSKAASNGQVVADKLSQPRKGLGLFAPYMKKNVLVEPRKKQTEAPMNATLSGILTNTEESAEDPWMDIVAEPSQPSHKVPLEPSPATTKSYKTALSFMSEPSEASNDTIVTWSAGAESARQPAPSLQSAAPTPEPSSKAMKEKKKGHISLSQTTESDDTTIQWSSFKRPPKAFYIHQDPTPPEQTRLTAPSNLMTSIPGSFPTASAPLAEASHNASSPKRSQRPPAHEKLTHCPCIDSHQSFLESLQSEMNAFKNEMEKKFERQKKRLEERVSALEESKVRLEGENSSLRAELARERWRGPRGYE